MHRKAGFYRAQAVSSMRKSMRSLKQLTGYGVWDRKNKGDEVAPIALVWFFLQRLKQYQLRKHR